MKLWPFRAVDDLAPPFELPVTGGIVETSRALTPPEADAVARLFDEPDDLRREIAQLEHVVAELTQALDTLRPAPDRYQLGALIEQQWHKHASTRWSTTEAWARVADTVIDHVRGLWPLETVAGGGLVVEVPPGTSTPGAPTPGDNQHLAALAEHHLEQLAQALCAHDEHHTGLTWDTARPCWRESYRGLAHAVALAGWRPPLTAGDPR